MSFFKGISGFIAIGGFVNGAPQLNGALTIGLTTLALDAGGGTVTGIIAKGDTFTIAGEAGSIVHTVTGGPFYSITGNALTGLTFNPGIASSGAADNAAITFTSNILAQAQDWSVSSTLADLDATSLGDKWKTSVTELGAWSGSIGVRLDYGQPGQAALLNMVSGSTPTSVIASMLLGIDNTASTFASKFLYGGAVLKSAAFGVQMGKLVDVKFAFTGSGALFTNWQ